MVHLVIIGGGWAGCASALAGIKAGARVTLIEKTDMLLGTGLVGGIMRNNGRFTASEELISMGAGELLNLTDSFSRHKNISFPGHKHVSLYNAAGIEPQVKYFLDSKKIEIRMEKRFTAADFQKDRIKRVILEGGEEVAGDVFIDATGSAGPMGSCKKYGRGCTMCILRCPSFGPRVSLTAKAGIREEIGENGTGTCGSLSGSCTIVPESINRELLLELREKGVLVIPLKNKRSIHPNLSKLKACQQYAGDEFKNNLILLDTGHVKLMVPFISLNKLRTIPGFENARFSDPLAGGKSNSIRFLSIAPRDNYMKVKGIDNLFCAGEKAGLFVGHTEAMVTGALAGHNAVRRAGEMPLLELPPSTVCGRLISFAAEKLKISKKYRFTFSGSIFFQHMLERKMYLTDKSKIADYIVEAGLTGILDKKIV